MVRNMNINVVVEHKISHRLLSLILAIAVFITMFSTVSLSTFADLFTAEYFVGDTSIEEGDTSGNGWRWESLSKTLYLYGANIEGYRMFPALSLPAGTTVKADGINRFSKKTTAESAHQRATIHCEGNLTILGSGKIYAENLSEATSGYGRAYVIEAEGKLVIDTGALELINSSTSEKSAAIGASSVEIKGGKVTVRSSGDGIYIPGGTYVQNGGYVDITAADSALAADSTAKLSALVKDGALMIHSAAAARNFTSFVNEGAVVGIYTTDTAFDTEISGGITVEHRKGVTLISSDAAPLSSKITFKNAKRTFVGSTKNALDEDDTDYSTGGKLASSDDPTMTMVLAADHYLKDTLGLDAYAADNHDLSGLYICSDTQYLLSDSVSIGYGSWFDCDNGFKLGSVIGMGTVYASNGITVSSAFGGTVATDGSCEAMAPACDIYCGNFSGVMPTDDNRISASGDVHFVSGGEYLSDANVFAGGMVEFGDNTVLSAGSFSTSHIEALGTLAITKHTDATMYVSGSNIANKSVSALACKDDTKLPEFCEYPYPSGNVVFTEIPDPVISISKFDGSSSTFDMSGVGANNECVYGTSSEVVYLLDVMYFEQNGEAFAPELVWQGTEPDVESVEFDEDVLTITTKATTNANEAGYPFIVRSGSTLSDTALLIINRIPHDDEVIEKYIRDDSSDMTVTVTLPELPEGASCDTASPVITGDFINNVSESAGVVTITCALPVAGENASASFKVSGAANYGDYRIIVSVKAIGAPEITATAQQGVINNGRRGSAEYSINKKYFEENGVPFAPDVVWAGGSAPKGVSVSFAADYSTLTITSDGSTPYSSTGYAFTLKSGETVSDNFSFIISKALYTGEKTASKLIYAAASGNNEVTLPALPTGAQYGTPSVSGDASGIIADAGSVSDGVLTFTASGSSADGDTADILIPVTNADNYDDFTVTVTVTAKNRPVINVSAQNGNMVYGTVSAVSFDITASNFETFGESYQPEVVWSGSFDGIDANLSGNKLTVTNDAAVLNAGSYGFKIVSGSHESEEQFLVVSKTTYNGNKTALKLVDFETGGTYKVKLPAVPDGAVYSSPFVYRDEERLLSGTPELLSGEIQIVSVAKAKGTEAQIRVSVTGAVNYEDYDVLVTVRAAAMNKIKLGTQNGTAYYGKGNSVTYTVTAENFDENGTEFLPEIKWAGTAPKGITAEFSGDKTLLTITDNSQGAVDTGSYLFTVVSDDVVSDQAEYKLSKSDYDGATETTKYVLANSAKDDIKVQLPNFDPDANYTITLVDMGDDVLLTSQYGLDPADKSILYFGVNSVAADSSAHIKVTITDLKNYNKIVYTVNVKTRGSANVTITGIEVEDGFCGDPAQVTGDIVLTDSEGYPVENVAVKYEWYDTSGTSYPTAPSVKGSYYVKAVIVDETGVYSGSKSCYFNIQHSFDIEDPQPGLLVEAANCMHPARYKYSCACGESDDSRYFEYGSVTGHVLVQKVEDQYLAAPATYFERAKYHYVCEVCDEVNEATYEHGEVLIDSTAPSAEIKIDDNGWNAFWNTVTFGLFFKETKTVTITAHDNDGGIGMKKTEYFITDQFITLEDLIADSSIVWMEYTEPFSIENNDKYVIYAKATDLSNNIKYISTDGFELDAIPPVISGVSEGAAYCLGVTVTVTDDNLSYVEINGTRFNVSSTSYTKALTDAKEYTVLAGDKAGGVSTVSFTVNAAHDIGVWQKLNESVHRRSCANCDYYETDNHTSGTPATYTNGALCAVCGGEYGDPLPDNRKPDSAVITVNGGEITYTDTYKTGDDKDKTAYCSAKPVITLTAHDNESGIADIYYAVFTDNSKTDDDLAALADEYWSKYTEPFELAEQFDGYCIYIKCVDRGGNAAYFVSPIMSYDFDAPVIEGVPSNGGVCDGSDIEITVSDDNMLYYTVNGERTDANGGTQFTVNITEDGTYEIAVFDIAGNHTQRTIVRSSDHVYGKWTSDGDSTHSKTCSYCGNEESTDHNMSVWNENSDGTTHTRKCVDCGYTESGEHIYGEWGNINSNTQHKRSCTLCGKAEIGDHDYSDWEYYNNEYHAMTCSVCNDVITEKHTGGLATFNEKPRCDVCHSLYGDGLFDDTAPTGEITVTIGEKVYKNDNNTLDETAVVYGNVPHTVMISASDEGLGVKEIQYYISQKVMSSAKLLALEETDWNDYEGTFTTDVEGKYFYYVKIIDNADNATYICSQPVVYDCTPPVINGVDAGKGYCGKSVSLKVTFSDENYSGFYWSKGGKPATLNTADAVTVTVTASDKGVTHSFKAVDLAGNETEAVVTMSYDHVYKATDSIDERQHNTECTVCGAKSRALHNMGAWTYLDDTMHTRSCSDGCGYSETGIHVGGEASYTSKATCSICKGSYGALLLDADMPTGSISISQNGTAADSTYTFPCENTSIADIKVQPSITIKAEDESSGIASVYYALMAAEYNTDKQVAAIAQKNWKLYGGAFSVTDADNGKVIYVKITDVSGNITYIRSGTLAVDITAPAFVGIVDGKVYCSDAVFTVNEKNLDKVVVKIGEEESQLMETDGKYVIPEGSGSVTVTASDVNGHKTVANITIKNGHEYGEWSYTDKVNHSRTCQVCKQVEKEAHYGGTPTYTELAICDVCGRTYGTTLPDKEPPKVTISTMPANDRWTETKAAAALERLYYNEPQMITIAAVDDESGIKRVDYKISFTNSKGETATTDFDEYRAPISLTLDGTYVITAKATDVLGNVKTISTDYIVIDRMDPIFEGITEGCTVCVEAKFYIKDVAVGRVLANNGVVVPYGSEYRIEKTYGKVTVVATDKAGNTSEITFNICEAHDYGAYEDDSENENVHSRVCKNCGGKEYVAHDYDKWTAIDDEMNEHFCTVCGHREVSEHRFGKYTTTAGGHSRVCTDCGYTQTKAHEFLSCVKKNDEKHENVCSVCGYSELSDHNWMPFEMLDENTHIRKCADCGAVKSAEHNLTKFTAIEGMHEAHCSDCEYFETKVHEYGAYSSNDKDTHSRSCIHCGATENTEHTESVWTDGGNVHEMVCPDCKYTASEPHDYDEWVQYGSDGHIRYCKICNHEELKAHVFGEWEKTEEGLNKHTCTECGFSEEVPHIFGIWVDISDDLHERHCEECDEVETAPHIYGDWTNYDDDTHVRSCISCGHMQYSTHEYGEWQENDERTHERACVDCGKKISAPHNFSQWIEIAEGSYVRQCEDCGYTEYSEHRFTDWIGSSTDPSQHLRFCPDCNTFEYEDHVLGVFTKQDGETHGRVCEVCGYVKTEPHNFTSWIDDNAPKYLAAEGEEGEETEETAPPVSVGTTHSRYCTDCGYVQTLDHNYTEWTDENGAVHGHVCTECGRKETAGHEFDAWKPDDDTIHSKECELCGRVESGEHEFGEMTSDEFTHSVSCTVCGYTETDAHSFSDWVNLGGELYEHTCEVCGYTERTGHRYGSWQASDSTTHSRICEDCGLIDSRSHEFGSWGYKNDTEHERTCPICGYVSSSLHIGGTATCSSKAACEICGSQYGEYGDHTLTTVGAHDSTCTAEGYTGDIICTTCNNTIKHGNIVAKKDHTFVNGICRVCGEFEVIDPSDVSPDPSDPNGGTTSPGDNSTPDDTSRPSDPSNPGNSDPGTPSGPSGPGSQSPGTPSGPSAPADNPPTGVNISKSLEIAALFATTPGITGTILIVKKKIDANKESD